MAQVPKLSAPLERAARAAEDARRRAEAELARARTVGFMSLRPGLSGEELAHLETEVLMIFADYRKRETGAGGGSGFYALTLPGTRP